MKKYLFILPIIALLLLGNGFVYAGVNGCCAKTSCACAKGNCCTGGKCACKGTCCTKGNCNCAGGKCDAKCDCQK